MSRHLSPAQVELLEQFDADEFGDVEFTELALEAGLSITRIGQALMDKRNTDRDAESPFTLGECP